MWCVRCCSFADRVLRKSISERTVPFGPFYKFMYSSSSPMCDLRVTPAAWRVSILESYYTWWERGKRSLRFRVPTEPPVAVRGREQRAGEKDQDLPEMGRSAISISLFPGVAAPTVPPPPRLRGTTQRRDCYMHLPDLVPTHLSGHRQKVTNRMYIVYLLLW